MPSFFDWAAGARGTAAMTREAFVEMESQAGRLLPRRNAGVHTLNAAQGSVFLGQPANPAPIPPAEALAVVDFWRAAGPSRWFAKDPSFDRSFREQFLSLHEAAARGELSGWIATPNAALALLLLLDQFPRNAFRGTPRMYATDKMARHAAAAAIDAGHDRAVETQMRLFFCLPFGHSEDAADQDHSVALAQSLAEPNPSHAKRHRDIIRRFGRFPHRNPILGRTMTKEEQQYLDEGGYAG